MDEPTLSLYPHSTSMKLQNSGVTRGVHVGSSAPCPYASAPISCMCSFVVYPAYQDVNPLYAHFLLYFHSQYM